MSGGPLREVMAYIWQACGESGEVRVPALEWWDGSIDRSDGKSHIIVAEPYQEYREPDAEILACGHEKDIRRWNGRNYYNRRRRCLVCALEASA